ncbi:MAG TPA: hypothetical protein VE093_46060 [Polyangiaceae bacterium]|nr:hypothetical protein [Polyangiaceae bacterium]
MPGPLLHRWPARGGKPLETEGEALGVGDVVGGGLVAVSATGCGGEPVEAEGEALGVGDDAGGGLVAASATGCGGEPALVVDEDVVSGTVAVRAPHAAEPNAANEKNTSEAKRVRFFMEAIGPRRARDGSRASICLWVGTVQTGRTRLAEWKKLQKGQGKKPAAAPKKKAG